MTLGEFERRAKYNGGYDRMIDEFKILDIHQIPDIFLEQFEVDFFCSNSKHIFLLRLRNRISEKYEVLKSDNLTNLNYLIAELPIIKIDNAFLKKVLLKFKSIDSFL